jgi:hypothetical protein
MDYEEERNRMPPFAISAVVKIALAALGGVAVVHWVVKEVRRVNDELDQMKRAVEPAAREALPTLRRDPATGDWRL